MSAAVLLVVVMLVLSIAFNAGGRPTGFAPGSMMADAEMRGRVAKGTGPSAMLAEPKHERHMADLAQRCDHLVKHLQDTPSEIPIDALWHLTSFLWHLRRCEWDKAMREYSELNQKHYHVYGSEALIFLKRLLPICKDYVMPNQ